MTAVLQATPANLSDLFRGHFDYIVTLVHKYGIERRDAEDVAMTILTKFIERDALEAFDPEREAEVHGVLRKAVFRTFLHGFVKTYVQHYRDMQGKRLRREPFSGDRLAPFFHGTGYEDDRTWFDVHGDHVLDTDEQDPIVSASSLASIRRHLVLVTAQQKRGSCDFAALFDAMIEQEEEIGRISPTLLAEHFGVHKNTAVTWVSQIRTHIASFLGR